MPARRLLPSLAVAGLVGAVAVVALLASPQQVRAAPADPAREAGVQVEGVGTASGRPDVLRVTIGVETSAENVDEALTAADEAARRVLAALRAADVPERDVQTVNVSVWPRHGHEGEEITGYTARHDLLVTLRSVDQAGETIAEAVEASGNAARVQSLAYALEDDEALQEQARAQAFADAQRKAEQYAELAGRELGDLVWVNEQVTPSGPIPYAGDSAAGGEAVPLAPGSTTVTVTAEARWSLR